MYSYIFRKVDGAISDLTKNFAEGTEYFKVDDLIVNFLIVSFSLLQHQNVADVHQIFQVGPLLCYKL